MAIGNHKKLLVALLTAGLLFGCGGAEERKAKYLERGKAYIEAEDWDKARVEIRNVLQIDPKTAEAHYLLGQVEENRQEWRRAYGAYSKAVELDPDNLPARERLAQFYMLQANAHRSQDQRTEEANALGQAQNEIDEILKRDPRHAGARALQASMLSREGRSQEALALVESVVNDAPQHGVAVSLLASLYEQVGRIADTERVLVDGIKQTNDPHPLRLRLAQFYARNDKPAESEAILRDIISDRPNEFAHRLFLAQFLAQSGKPEKAEDVLREAVSEKPDDPRRILLLADLLANTKNRDAGIEYLLQAINANPEISELYFSLAQFYEQEQLRDKAKQVYERIISRFGDDAPGLMARNRLAIHADQEGDTETVRRQIATVLEKNPKDNDALLLTGRLAMRDSDYDAAVNAFRSVLRDQPESIAILHLLAEAHLRKGEVELAGNTLQRAVELAPNDAGARVKYARYLLLQRDLTGALEHVDRALIVAPDNSDARAAKTEVLAAQGDLGAVKAELIKLKRSDPDNLETYLRMGRVLLAERDLDGALSEVEEVLARDTNHAAALLLKTDILAARQDIDALQETIQKIKTVLPDNPEGYFRMGRVLRGQGDVDGALREYERAYSLAQDAGRLLMLTEIIATQLAADQSSQALARLERIIQDNPEHPNAHLLLGNVHAARNNYSQAEAAYATQIRLSPSAAGYARLAAVRGMQGDTAGAIASIRKGLELDEENVNLLLGLASYHQGDGDIDAAIASYDRVLALRKSNAVAANNLAALLADHRQDPESLARAKELADLLGNLESPLVQDTVGWVYYRNGDYARAVEVLEPVVEAAPEMAVFHYHLGMAYAGAGDKAKARTHLSRALELGDFAEEEKAREALAGL